MADTTIVTWNAANWITVVLMVTVGLAIIGVATKMIRSRQSTAE